MKANAATLKSLTGDVAAVTSPTMRPTRLVALPVPAPVPAPRTTNGFFWVDSISAASAIPGPLAALPFALMTLKRRKRA